MFGMPMLIRLRDIVIKASCLECGCPAVPSTSWDQMWSVLSNLPIDCLKKNPFNPSAFGGTRGHGLRSSISVQNGNQIQDWITPFSAHYVLLAEKQENRCKPFWWLRQRARAMSCAEASGELLQVFWDKMVEFLLPKEHKRLPWFQG